MAVVKPLKPTVNYEEAWKELKSKYGTFYKDTEEGRCVGEMMGMLEIKHKNMITIERRSNPEMVDYCIKKSVEAQMENIHLKKKLREQKGLIITKAGFSKFEEPERKLSNVKGIIKVSEEKREPERNLFKVHLVCLTKDDSQFVFDWEVTEKKLGYLSMAHHKREEISWHGLKWTKDEDN